MKKLCVFTRDEKERFHQHHRSGNNFYFTQHGPINFGLLQLTTVAGTIGNFDSIEGCQQLDEDKKIQ